MLERKSVSDYLQTGEAWWNYVWLNPEQVPPVLPWHLHRFGLIRGEVGKISGDEWKAYSTALYINLDDDSYSARRLVIDYHAMDTERVPRLPDEMPHVRDIPIDSRTMENWNEEISRMDLPAMSEGAPFIETEGSFHFEFGHNRSNIAMGWGAAMPEQWELPFETICKMLEDLGLGYDGLRQTADWLEFERAETRLEADNERIKAIIPDYEAELRACTNCGSTGPFRTSFGSEGRRPYIICRKCGTTQ